MKILLSNDDGYHSDGIRCLAENLSTLADVTIVAPDRDRSGASNSLTLDTPLRVYQAGDNVFFLNGTPTDCVHLAITGLFAEEHDMVVSGINDGANLGDDVLYSGTVAAAIEGRFLGLPAIAISLVPRGASRFDTAGRVAHDLVRRLLVRPLPSDTILNVNVPDIAYEELAGYRATRLGFRHRSEAVVPGRDPKGRTIYWVGPAGPEQESGPGTDFHAVAEGFVSVTPLQVDLTRHSVLGQIQEWLES